MHKQGIDDRKVLALAEGHCSTMTPHCAWVIVVVTLFAGCASLPPGSDFPRIQSSALKFPEQTRLGNRVEATARKYKQKSGFRLLPVGVDGFLTRAQMINAAERTLDVQYYIFRDDDSGRLLTDSILSAADRGVRVRVLLDDFTASERHAQIAALDAHPNIEIRLFNPAAYRGKAQLFRFFEYALNASRLDYRMHNKLFVVDNVIALVGGRNIGDEYFQVGPEIRFGDYDVFAAGPIAKHLSATFDSYWNDEIAIPIEALGSGRPSAGALDEYRNALGEHRRTMEKSGFARRLASGEPLAGLLSGRLSLVWAQAEVVYDSPDKKRVENGERDGRLVRQPVAEAAAAVQSEFLIVSPYLVPGEEGMRLIRDLRKRDVRVRVLTNSLESTDHILAHAGYTHYRLSLLEDGVELYEVRPVLGRPKGSGETLSTTSSGRFALHAKAFVFDRRKVFIGSMNFDRRSFQINTEIGLIIDSPELARQVAARFESIAQPANSYVLMLRPGAAPRLLWRAEEKGRVVEFDREPSRSAGQRARLQLLRLLPLDGEL